MRAEVVRRDAPGDDDGRGIWRQTCSGCGQRNPGHPGSRCPGKLVIISDPPLDLLSGRHQVNCDHQRQQVADLLARGVPLASGDGRPAPCQVADLLARSAGDLRAGRDAPPEHSVLPAYAADLVANGASLSYTRTAYGGTWVITPSHVERWERVVARLRIFARRQERRRAGYFYALDKGVGRALGWAERTGWSYRCWRACKPLVAAARAALVVLFEHVHEILRGAAGVATLAALYRLLPGVEEAPASGAANASLLLGDARLGVRPG